MTDQTSKHDTAMSSSRVISERGQTVVPKPIRDYMDLQTGDRLEWIVQENGTVAVYCVKRKSLMDLQGIVKASAPADDLVHRLDEAIREARDIHYTIRQGTETGTKTGSERSD